MARPGYLKLWRSIIDKPIWKQSTPEQKTILITLLIMADFNKNDWEFEGKQYKTMPGQFVTSLPSIVAECGKGITIQNVRTALKRFEKLGFLTDKSTKVNRLITIVNWEVYQSSDSTPNSQTNSDLTDDQQTPNSQLTSNEEVKKLRSKEVKNVVVVNEDFKSVFNMYQANIEFNPSQTTTTKLSDDFDLFGKEIMEYAIEKSALLNNHDYRFINYLLKEWRKNQLTSIEAVKQFEDRKQNTNKTQKNNNQEYQNKYPNQPELSFSNLTMKMNRVGYDGLTEREQKAIESYY